MKEKESRYLYCLDCLLQGLAYGSRMELGLMYGLRNATRIV